MNDDSTWFVEAFSDLMIGLTYLYVLWTIDGILYSTLKHSLLEISALFYENAKRDLPGSPVVVEG